MAVHDKKEGVTFDATPDKLFQYMSAGGHPIRVQEPSPRRRRQRRGQ